jgi:hypothetical protein
MDTNNSRKHLSQNEKRVLPTLRIKRVAGKNLIVLAKVEFNRNMAKFKQTARKSRQETMTAVSKEHLSRDIAHSTESQISKT